MNENYIIKNECRCCGSKELTTYIDLGKQPLANSYHKNDVINPKIPLEVNVCNVCFNSQLSVVVKPEIMFKHYLYVSGTTKSFRNHCKQFAKETVDIVGVKNPNVLDIACNDGTLLDEFKNLGSTVYGVDPAENIRDLSKEKGFDVCVDFWNESSANHFNTEFDIITATNVFAHVDDVYMFLNTSKSVLSTDGRIVIEFPYCADMIKHNEFDTIYHEHVSYFLVNSIKTLSDRLDLVITNIIKSNIHGGSIRFYFSKTGTECVDVSALISTEQQNGMMEIKTYLDFSNDVNRNKTECVELINELRAECDEIIGYGASAKGNTMLNFFGIYLDKIIDDNQLKISYLTPGTNIEIVGSNHITNTKSCRIGIVLTAWNFADEIISKVESIKRADQTIKYIYYVPDVRVVCVP